MQSLAQDELSCTKPSTLPPSYDLAYAVQGGRRLLELSPQNDKAPTLSLGVSIVAGIHPR
jgi:hypothetical protein